MHYSMAKGRGFPSSNKYFVCEASFNQLEEFVGKECAHKKTEIANQEKNKPHNRDPNFGKCESSVL